MIQYPIHPAKRFVDVVFSTMVLVCLLPFIVLCFTALFLEHVLRGRPFDPLLYSEIRFSQGNPFTLYKFNIFKHDIVLEMRARREFIHTKDLERRGSLLTVGWLLKQVYLDELPQFFNILRGDMSLVGPRPVNEVVFKDLMARDITDKAKVRAGLTGHYQSHKHTAGKRSDDMDREYVEFCAVNPWYKILYFDLEIILRTIKVLLLARGV